MSNIQRTPVYSEGNQIIGYRDASEEAATAPAGSQEARIDALEVAVAATPTPLSPVDACIFKSEFTKGTYDQSKDVFVSAIGPLQDSDANTTVVLQDAGKYLVTYGSSAVAAPAYDGFCSVYMDDIGFGGSAVGTIYFAPFATANGHFKMYCPTGFDQTVPSFEIIARVGGHTAPVAGTGRIFIGFREGTTAINNLLTERLGIECDWATPNDWHLRLVNKYNGSQVVAGTPGITLTAGGNTWKWMKAAYDADTLTLSLYGRASGAWALIDSIVMTEALTDDTLNYFVVEAFADNGTDVMAIALDYLEVNGLGSRDE